MANHLVVNHVLTQATEQELSNYCSEYWISDYILMRLPVEDERINNPHPEWVRFYLQMF